MSAFLEAVEKISKEKNINKHKLLSNTCKLAMKQVKYIHATERPEETRRYRKIRYVEAVNKPYVKQTVDIGDK